MICVWNKININSQNSEIGDASCLMQEGHIYHLHLTPICSKLVQEDGIEEPDLLAKKVTYDAFLTYFSQYFGKIIGIKNFENRRTCVYKRIL